MLFSRRIRFAFCDIHKIFLGTFAQRENVRRGICVFMEGTYVVNAPLTKTKYGRFPFHAVGPEITCEVERLTPTPMARRLPCSLHMCYKFLRFTACLEQANIIFGCIDSKKK